MEFNLSRRFIDDKIRDLKERVLKFRKEERANEGDSIGKTTAKKDSNGKNYLKRINKEKEAQSHFEYYLRLAQTCEDAAHNFDEIAERYGNKNKSGAKNRLGKNAYKECIKNAVEERRKSKSYISKSEHYKKIVLNAHPFGKKSGFEKSAVAVSLISLIGGSFLLSFNLTGNVVGNLNQTSSNFIGVILFVLGLIGAFIYFRKKEFSAILCSIMA